MKTFVRIIPALTLALSTLAGAQVLDQKSATVSMDVGRYAAITGLDDFVLRTNDVSGSAGAVYSGSDEFNLESNSQVHVTLTGGDLSNGKDSVSTSYNLDGSSMQFDTAADSVHAGAHTVAASAKLGAISAQKAGAYSSTITITVSAI